MALKLGVVMPASAELGVPADALLESFGEYWTLYVAEKGYGSLLDMAGDSLFTCLQHLDRLHVKVKESYPDLQPQSFRFEELGADTGLLHYHSHREGLAPMVIGLLRGLATRYGTPVDIAVVKDRRNGADHDIFQVTLRKPSTDAGSS